MNVEKFVKNEARSALSGNWIKALLALLTAMLVPLSVLLVIDIAAELMGGYSSILSSISEKPVQLVFFVLFHLAAVVGLLMLSPLFAGCFKLFCSLAENKKSDAADLFYFFSSVDKYKDCVKFMTRMIVSCVAAVIVCELPCLAAYAALKDSDSAEIVCIVLAAAGIIAALLFMHRYIFAVMLYTHFGKGMSESLAKGADAARGNVGKLIKLTFSFIGWIISLLLVVPFLYVFPYMTCSHFVSAKYLLEQYDKQHEKIPVSEFTAGMNSAQTGSPFVNSSYSSVGETSDQTTSTISEVQAAEVKTEQSTPITLEKGGAVDSDL